MIYELKEFPGKKFTDKMDQTRFIKKNFHDLKGLKKEQYKTFQDVIVKDGLLSGNFEPVIEDISGDFLIAKTVINSTNVIDSHIDLHLIDIWNKTVKDNPFTHHLKQHEKVFESVISSKAKQYNEKMNFKDLGIDVDFEMTANINEVIISREKSPFMFDKYKDGEVKQHSVGMMYLDYDIAYYDEDSQKEMDFFEWAKSQAINPEVADEYGMVWVHREAKKREGSAVVFGSNPFTPTLYVKNYEPSKNTRDKNEPPLNGTQNKSINKFINPNLF